VEIGIPEFGVRLLLEPLLHHKQTEDDASLVLLSSSGLRSVQHRLGQDRAMRFGDLILLEFAGNDLFDLVLQTQRDLGDFFRVDGRGW
jgi:hypothetical protein